MSGDEIQRKFDSVADLIHSLAADSKERHNRQMEDIRRETQRIDHTLRRAIHFAVREARAERRRRLEGDERLDNAITKLSAAQLITEEKLDRLSAAQLVTEQKLQVLIDTLRAGTNGKP